MHYCESIQRTLVQAATVQFLNRGHVWVVAILAQNLQDYCIIHFGQLVDQLNFVKLSIVSLVCHDVGSRC